MPSDPSRLDLIRSSATNVALQANLDLDLPSLGVLLAEYAMSDPTGRKVAFFHTDYRRSRVEHACVGSIIQAQAGGTEFRFVLTYSVGPTASLPMPERTRQVLDLLVVLAESPDEYAFDCQASFRYPASRYLSHVPVPLAVGQPSELPYTDIRGVHLAKVRDGATLYDAIIDHAPRETDAVLHMVSFEYLSRFTLELPGDILRFAEDISREFGELHD